MRSRVVRTRQIGEKAFQYSFKIIDIPSAPGSQESLSRQAQLLQELVSQPALLMCGPIPFERLSMVHNGVEWIVEGEATHYIDREEDAPQSS